MLNDLKRQAAAAAKKKHGPKPPPAEHVAAMTVAEWCRETNGERHALMQKLSEARIAPVGDAKGRASGAKLYRIGDLYRAMGGGVYEAERLRKTREEADKLAIQNARSRGELIEISTVKKLGQEVMKTVTTAILNMPMTDEEKDKCLSNLLVLGDMDWDRIVKA